MQRAKLTDPVPPWTEARIGRMLAEGLLTNRSILVVPNCNWTGHECDLLVIEHGLRIIDVEIKISRADLRADLKKDKWWVSKPWSRRAKATEPDRTRAEWPPKVWKHYYALPEAIWKEQLLDAIPAASGVILLCEPNHWQKKRWLHIKRRAKPNKDAKPISQVEAIDIARLASLRMWAALNRNQENQSGHLPNQSTSAPARLLDGPINRRSVTGTARHGEPDRDPGRGHGRGQDGS